MGWGWWLDCEGWHFDFSWKFAGRLILREERGEKKKEWRKWSGKVVELGLFVDAEKLCRGPRSVGMITASLLDGFGWYICRTIFFRLVDDL